MLSALPIKTVDIELSQPLQNLIDLDKYASLYGLVRLNGIPIGEITLPISHGCCNAEQIAKTIFPYYTWAVARQLVQQALAAPVDQNWNIADLLDQAVAHAQTVTPIQTVTSTQTVTPTQIAHQTTAQLPLVTVVVTVESCHSSEFASNCLTALQKLAYPQLEVLIIEIDAQRGKDSILQSLIAQQTQFHYFTALGRNAARNLAVAKASGEIIAFTEGNCSVDADWITSLVNAFIANPAIEVITGLVMTADITTEAQNLFHKGYGLGRGWEARWHRIDPDQPIHWTTLGTMQIGSGANMAFRRSRLEKRDGFDLTFDQTGYTGGDWEMFCRCLLSGATILYEPTAIVRYHAPSQTSELQQYLSREISSFYAYVLTGMQRYPQLWFNFFCLGLWKLARLVKAYLRPGIVPRQLIATELRAAWLWFKRTIFRHSSLPETPTVQLPTVQPSALRPAEKHPTEKHLTAVRSINLQQPLPDLNDVSDYRTVRLFVTLGDIPVGTVDIEHYYQPISKMRLQQSIANQLYLELLALPHHYNKGAAWTQIETLFAQHWLPSKALSLPTLPSPLPIHVPVSIIITTCDRPADLADCLRHLQAQQTQRSVEIIVADNRPASGLTPPVVAEFAGVKLVSEPRPGGSYGRNAAICASTGEIVVSVDDDVVVPPDWLEKLIAPMARPEVMVVTGNVLPLELETTAQILFEQLKGGLGEGFQPFEVDRNWWASLQQSPPTWDLGVSANAAFRATIFSHPEIGLMDEVLGPGTPTVGGEENHLIYKVLRAGGTLVYEPSAFVWHKHRRDLPALYRQVYGHMKGGTAYHLLLWQQEKDARGLRQLIYELPRYYSRHLIARLKGQHQTPWRFLWSEIAGYFAGYWGYYQSQQRVRQQGRSAPYIPVSQRSSSSSLTPEPPPNPPEWGTSVGVACPQDIPKTVN